MFDDTVKRNKPNFEWTAEEKSQLEMVTKKTFLINYLFIFSVQNENDVIVRAVHSRDCDLHDNNHPSVLRFQ